MARRDLERRVPRTQEEQARVNEAIAKLGAVEAAGIDVARMRTELLRISADPGITEAPVLDRLATDLADKVGKALDRLGPAEAQPHAAAPRKGGAKPRAAQKAAYETKLFKCMGDYEKCRKAHSGLACSIMLVLSVAQLCIPLANVAIGGK